MNKQQVMAAMEEAHRLTHILAKRYEGHYALFMAASQQGDGAECDSIRAQMHDCIDKMLDELNTMHMLERQLYALGRNE